MRFFYTRLLFLVVLLFSWGAFAQTQSDLENLQAERQEYYFQLKVDNPKEFEQLNHLFSIDKITDSGCIGYANPLQYARLLTAGYQLVLLTPPSLEHPNQPMLEVENWKSANEWDTYPTYPAYVAMMEGFTASHPDKCSIHNIGTLPSGRQILVARINNGNSEGKTEFLYTSSIHGDETTGYVLMLRLIDYLLNGYGNDPEVTYLMDNLDIWINPLANPDGTYYGGNNTVNGARRGNANNVDLNRNFPDPEDGQHPDGYAWQPETVMFMDFGAARNFSMSVNFHGGAEVLNYPWDTWSRRHADNNWWMYICREYVDTVHLHSPSGYLTDLNNGITNGYDWYSISGGRQDYMNYFEQCREMTLEISGTKLVPAAQLPNFWNYNKRSLLNYLKQATYGFSGTVTDSITHLPLRAKVEIVGHDLDHSYVYSSEQAGNYSRPIKAGTYNLTFSAEGYYSKTIQNLTIADKQVFPLDVQLRPGNIIADFTASVYEIAKGGSINFFDGSYGLNVVSWSWEFEGGVPANSSSQNPVNITYPNSGEFDVKLTITNASGQSSSILKNDLIKVSSMYLMTNGVFATCEGTFYDSGGPSNNYGSGQEMTMTFIPDTEEALTKVEFTQFDLEAQSTCNYDWLKIYNGLNTSAPLLGTWCGTNSPGTIIANNPGKGLTFQFHSDGSVAKAGWAANISCFSTVGLNENEAKGLRVYPNPVRGTAVKLQSAEVMFGLQLLDLSGKIISIHTLDGVTSFDLETNHLKNGIYLLEVKTMEGSAIQKLFIAR